MKISDINNKKIDEAGKYGNPEKGVQVRTTQKTKKQKPSNGHESPHPMRGKLVGEADEPKTDSSARAKLDHSLRAQGHKVEKDRKKAIKKGEIKHKKSLYQEMIDLEEGPLVLNRESDLRGMLDTLLKSWLSQGDHTEEEYKKLLKALGYQMKKDGQRTTLVKEAKANPKVVAKFADVDAKHRSYYIMKWAEKKGMDSDEAMELAGYVRDGYIGAGAWNWRYVGLEEGTGAIRGGLAAIALIASLWGVNNNMAQKAYDASPQLQKLTAYLEVAKQHNDQRMIDQLEQRIGNHKMRLSLGKGDVMGKDGRPIDVVYDKEKSNEGEVIDFPQKTQDASFSLDKEVHKHAQIHAIKGKDLEKYIGKKVKIWQEGSSNAPLQRSYKIDPGKNSEGVTIEGTYYGPEEFVTHNSADDYSWKSESAANLYSDMVDSARDDEEFDEETKKDACYHKVRSRYKVWPSAYASGALVQCRKKGAKNWGNKSK